MFGLVHTGRDSDSLVLAERQNPQSNASFNNEKPSIDQVAEVDLAASLATNVDLPVAINVSNQAISVNAKNQLAQTSDETISKPQIIASNVSASRTFTTYKTLPGDTLNTVATKFNLNKNTIKWSNNIAGDALEPGRNLLIPPVDGIVYSSQPGDTAGSVAAKFNGDKNRVILFNDLENVTNIAAGTRIIIPDGSPANVPVSSGSNTSSSSSSSSASSASIFANLSGGNRYDYGYCTWYAYNRRAALGQPIGGMWGNASSWASLARATGFTVNNQPSIGAVLQHPTMAGGYGHVAVVESINSDGSIYISEMNYAGWNVVSTRTISADSVGSYSYIH